MVKTDHQNFLTLGLSSYPGSPQLEGEVNSEETMNMEDVHRIKGLDVFHEEEDDNLQLQMCNPQQVQYALFGPRQAMVEASLAWYLKALRGIQQM